VLQNNLKNELAMTTLKSGFAASPSRHFLPPRPEWPVDNSFGASLAGVLVSVLGPSHSERTIRDLKPPQGRTYIALDNNVVDRDIQTLPDFQDYVVDQQIYRADFPMLFKNLKTGAIVNASRRDPLALAVALEQAVNGTSLVLAFEFAGHVLIFPGDAQWGTWDQAMNDSRTQELLRRTTVLKVGHHGSHNATPARLLEEFIAGARAALIPVQADVFDDIPRGPLLDELANASRFDRVIRSDQPGQSSDDVEVDPAGWWTELTLR
jgi:hypothetical protein